MVSIDLFMRLSWRQRSHDIKFSADPEWMRAIIGVEKPEAIKMTIVVNGVDLTFRL